MIKKLLVLLALLPTITLAQTALNLGGTGWSTSTTGDLLVGTTSKIRYTRLPVGSVGQVLWSLGGSPAWVATSSLGFGTNFWGGSLTDGIYNLNTGNTGIGTTTPTSIFTIASSTATGATSLFSVATTSPFFNVLANGNVGIGTATPINPLDLYSAGTASLGNGAYPLAIRSTGGNTTATGFTIWNPSNTMGSFFTFAFAGNAVTGARLGVATTSNGVLMFSNGPATDGAAFIALGTSNASPVYFSTNSVIRQTVGATGNIGIGTTTPTDKLQIAGNTTPSLDATYGLGSSTLRWLNLFSQNIYASSSVITNSSSTGLTATNLYGTNIFPAGLSNTFLALDTTGKIVATTTPLLTAYTGTYPIIVTGTVISSGFTTSTINVFSATNTFATTTTNGSSTILGQLYTKNASSTALTVSGATVLSTLTSTTHLPVANLTSDLGSNALRWNNIFTGSLFASSSVLTTASTTSIFSTNATTTNFNFTHATGTNLALSGLFRDSISANGTLGQVLWATGTSTLWVATTTLGISGSLSGGLNGRVARWTSPTSLSTGILIDNGTIAGVNATTTSYTFNLQANAVTNPFQIASSSGLSFMHVDKAGYVGIGTTTFDATNPAKLVIDASTTVSEEGLGVYGNVNDFFEGNIFNKSAGANSQACWTTTGNIGTLTAGFLSICSNSSTFNNPQAYNTGGAGDTSIMGYSTGDFLLVNATPTKSMLFLTGGSASTTYTRMSIDGNGAVRIATTTNPIYGFTVSTTTQFTAGTISRVFGYTSSSTITVDVSRTDVATTTINQTTTFANPIGTVYDGQMFEIIGLATTTQTVSFGTNYASSTDLTNITSVASGTTRWLFEYNGYRTRWDLVGLLKTYQ